MNPELSKNALDKIEALCGDGCSEVNQLLDRAKNGSCLGELSEFSHSEIKLILNELDKIMSVYEKRD